MPRKAIYTPEERKIRDNERHKKWFHNKYHNDEEFRKRQNEERRERLVRSKQEK